MSDAKASISDGIRAAGLLEEACRSVSLDASRIEVVRRLAHDLERELESLSDLAGEDAPPDILAEAAICCADLANLAACNAPDLPPGAALRAVSAARLAAAAVNALGPIIEAGSTDLGDGHAENLRRDARSACWRAQFAARLAEEPDKES